MVDGHAMDIGLDLSRRVDAGDDLMGQDDDEWVVEEDSVATANLHTRFDYEQVIQSERDRLATLRPQVKHIEWKSFRRTATGYIGSGSSSYVPPSIIPSLDDVLAMRFAGATMRLVESTLHPQTTSLGIPWTGGIPWNSMEFLCRVFE